ncbi:MAG: glucosamine-6-phosphate deaminase [Anaerolineae bacterium]|nr:glucosamine-6-phosphate deaminase [Anaerolineae bacterium]
MEIHIFDDKNSMGAAAAQEIAHKLKIAITDKNNATMILATGASQFEMLEHLVKSNVDWSKVTVFHLDEYIGLSVLHPASFRKYLKERFADRIEDLKDFHYINGESIDPLLECERLGTIIRKFPVDVACIGIGENGHLAFNDPPADFDTEEPYIIVSLDEACRRQQLGEGWFPAFEDVPKQAISMSIQHIMKSNAIVCTVPDKRKANAVKAAVDGQVTNTVPASILQNHPRCSLYLDRYSAANLAKLRE